MPDTTAGAPGAPAPDFLDRLLARHADPSAARRPDVVRVRPRLPGPFERIEAVRGRDTDQDGQEPLRPVTAPLTERHEEPAARPAPREVLRTEHERTVVHSERAQEASQAPRPAAPLVPEAPPLRPVTSLTPGPRPAPEAGRRTSSGRDRVGAVPGPGAAPAPAGPDTSPRPAGTAPPRPSAADTAAARDAVRQASARRTGRGDEQVVQVQIGRLEVTAAEPSGGRERPRPRGTGRPQAAVSLAEYLGRGRE